MEGFEYDSFDVFDPPSTLLAESLSTKWVRGLVNLKVLRLSGLDLYQATSPQEKFGEHIPYLSNLRELELSYCNISTPVFPIHEFYNLSRLSSFKMNHNFGLHFPFPVELANLTSLSILELSGCNLHGSVPYLDGSLHSSFYDLSELQYLDLSDNSVTGTIPSCLSKLQNLRHFAVAGNSIEGNVSFFSLMNENLLALDMSLTGTIPSCLFKLKHLLKIYLPDNKLHGPLPLPPKGITEFDLSSNKFSGEISSKLGRRLFNAHSVSLAGNQLSGSIPFIICSTQPRFTSTHYIDLSNNKLSGTIPSNIGYCGNMRGLQLGNNNLTGNVPDGLKLAKYISFLQLKLDADALMYDNTQSMKKEITFLCPDIKPRQVIMQPLQKVHKILPSSPKVVKAKVPKPKP
ncbi:LRR receptor-like serine/threonine-protein kinase FLS2 [Papaver somniferum]|uniref:LRR receptor-like serine/threonine-protein kinase FLS2 n=1 Tax=Papaver somniferum TaxID=3469 RepID=UPI000E70034A|nr:LRR receptor-like serine/threonine-protein kinase FLS2 [Papaver somniferum]